MNCVERYFQSEFKNSERPAIVFYNGLDSLEKEKRVVSFKKADRELFKGLPAFAP